MNDAAQGMVGVTQIWTLGAFVAAHQAIAVTIQCHTAEYRGEVVTNIIIHLHSVKVI